MIQISLLADCDHDFLEPQLVKQDTDPSSTLRKSSSALVDVNMCRKASSIAEDRALSHDKSLFHCQAMTCL
jgi:hypothetical protein